jgi:hypothetical protein
MAFQIDRVRSRNAGRCGGGAGGQPHRVMNPSLLVAAVGLPAAALYLIVFGLLLPGAASVFAFIAVAFFFPNYGTYYFGFGDTPAYFFLEVVAAVSVLLAIMRERRVYTAIDGRERMVCGLLIATVVVHLLLYVPLRLNGFYPPGPGASSVAYYATEMLCSLCFLYGCVFFIRTLRQIEWGAWLFVICGVELLAERFVFGGLGLFPQIGRYAFDEIGRFESLVENEPLAVGIYASVAMLCALYLAIRRRSVVMVVLVALFWHLAFTVYQRTFAVAPLIAAIFFAWKASRPRVRLACAAAACAAVVVIAANASSVEQRLQSLYIGTWRDNGPGSNGLNPFSTDQLEARLGYQARGLDVFVHLFPFGTGERAWHDYQASPAIPSRFAPAGVISPLRPYADVARKTYQDALFGWIKSEAHNGYLEHVIAYGVLGILGELVFIGVIVANYRRSRASPRVPRAFVFAVLALFGFFFLFYSFPKIYVAYMFFFHASFVLSARDAREAA